MEKVKKLLNRIFIDGLSGMALGLFSTLIVGTIIQQIGKLVPGTAGDFLYLIGSVFAPMIAIMIADYFILQKNHSGSSVNVVNLIIWIIGFAVYRMLMNVDLPLGSTLTDMVITLIICIVADKLIRR